MQKVEKTLDDLIDIYSKNGKTDEAIVLSVVKKAIIYPSVVIDAIPVYWIDKWSKNNKYPVSLTKMLCDWTDQNGKKDPENHNEAD